MGVICPLDEQVDQYWERLLAGESGIVPITRFDPAPFEVRFGGECAGFEPTRYIDPRMVKRIDRFAQFAQAAGQAAMADSKVDVKQLDLDRFGVILGSGIGGLTELEEQHLRL